MQVRELLEKAIHPNITYKYVKDVEGDDNRGWITDRVRAYLDGKQVGYAKVAYIPSDRFERYYPGILNYITQISGNSVLPHKYKSTPWQQIPPEELADSIYFMALHAGMGWTESNQLSRTAKEAGPQRIQIVVAELEQRLIKEKGNLFKQFKKYYVDKPVIDFLHVDEEYRNQGIGTGLFDAAARWMRHRGLPLYATSGQKGYTEQIWKGLEKRYPTKTVKQANPVAPSKRITRRHIEAN